MLTVPADLSMVIGGEDTTDSTSSYVFGLCEGENNWPCEVNLLVYHVIHR